MENSEKFKYFEEELAIIQDSNIRDFTKKVMARCPDYAFEDCPSSSTGKHHPTDELGPDGNVIHTKKVIKFAQHLCRAYQLENIMDGIIAACILHDLTKRGLTRGKYTIKHHARMMAQIVLDVYADLDRYPMNPETARFISDCIKYHYGPWTEDTINKPMYRFTIPETIVYLSDYLASRKTVFVK